MFRRRLVQEVVRLLPADEEELAACLQRRWRAVVLAEAMLRLTRTWREGGPHGAAQGH